MNSRISLIYASAIMVICAGLNAGEAHRSIIFKTKGPKGMINPCADRMNSMIKKFKKTMPKPGSHEYDQFFNWAVWAYLSGDSVHQGDEQLLKMISIWLDQTFERLQKKPEANGKKKGKKQQEWRPNRLPAWFFQAYSTPLIEIMQNKKAVETIGLERIEKLKKIVLENFDDVTAEKQKEQLDKWQNYINMLYHLYPYYLADYLIAGDKSALAFCEKTNAHMLRQQNPNGSYPYRLLLYGPKHRESDSMYYHSIINRGLYLQWWYTGSKSAETILKNSIPYYPLTLCPPYHFSSGADIWWKDQWRTFWPQHVAMVAAVTGDGENATIARRMGKDKKSVDWFDNVIGAHAYRLLAEKKIEDKPVRDNYIIEDPDACGLRSRWGNWNTLFSTGSFGFTRTSAMLTDGKTFDALHLARPVFRTTNYAEAPNKIEPGEYSCMNRTGDVETASVIEGNIAAIGTRYHQALTAMTWREKQPLSPWQTCELWLVTPNGLVGLIRSTLERDAQGFEMMHQYRFICSKNRKSDTNWITGRIAFKVWDTNFKNQIKEHARRFAFDTKKKPDSQLALSDTNRSPLEVIHTKGAEKTLPTKRDYQKGTTYYSLVSITPQNTAPKAVKHLEDGDSLAFSVTDSNNKQYKVTYNPDSGKVTLSDQ